MRILITGGSGFIGSNISEYLLNQGHQVSAVGRSADRHRIHHEDYRYIEADTTSPGKWQKEVGEADAVVNLTGATIFKRWTAKYKKLIYDSRIQTTRHVVAALPEDRNIILCSASGAGYYGNRGDDVLNEDEGLGQDFLANLSRDWEKEALQAADNDGHELKRPALDRRGMISLPV